MNNIELLNAMTDVSDKYILEAAPVKKVVTLKKKIIRTVSAAACICIVLAGGMAATTYAKPVSYIGMDVNPSIELCLNKWNRVIDVVTYNEEASEICNNLKLKHKYYTNAVEILLSDDEFSAYCKNDETSDLTFTIVSDDCEDLQDGIRNCNGYSESSGEIHYADEETLEAAHDNKCSIGKYAAYEELQRYDSGLTIEDCNNMTMHELHEEIDSHHSGNHDSHGYDGETHNSSIGSDEIITQEQNHENDSEGHSTKHTHH